MFRMYRLAFATTIVATIFSFVIGPAAAQDYPNRPIKLIVPWPPGGGTDVIGRLLAAKLSISLGQQVVVENRAGAASIVGMTAVATAPADGYTIGLATSNLAVNPSLYPKIPYDAAADLAPVILVSKGVYALAVHPGVAANTVSELVAITRAAPGKYNASLIGPGTPPHLALAQFNSLTGANVIGIHYKGAGPSTTAAIAGETQMVFASYATLKPMIQSGRLRLLAVTSAKRSSAAPDVPTVIESGLPGFLFEEWYALFAPAKTPRAAIDRINAEVRKVLVMADVRERMDGLASEPSPGAPEALGDLLRTEMVRWSKIVREAGIKIE